MIRVECFGNFGERVRIARWRWRLANANFAIVLFPMLIVIRR